MRYNTLGDEPEPVFCNHVRLKRFTNSSRSSQLCVYSSENNRQKYTLSKFKHCNHLRNKPLWDHFPQKRALSCRLFAVFHIFRNVICQNDSKCLWIEINNSIMACDFLHKSFSIKKARVTLTFRITSNDSWSDIKDRRNDISYHSQYSIQVYFNGILITLPTLI